MKKADCDSTLHDLEFTAASRQIYSKKLEWRWNLADHVVRIVVGVVAAFSLLFTALDNGWTTPALIAAIVGLCVALVLNVVPFGTTARFYTDLVRQWSDLRLEADTLKLRIADLAADNEISEPLAERLEVLTQNKHRILACEPAPWKKLLQRCVEDRTEATWGKGIRTPQQIHQELARRAQEQPADPKPES